MSTKIDDSCVNFHDTLMSLISNVYEQRKEQNPFPQGTVEPITRRVGYTLHQTNEHRLLFVTETNAFCFLLIDGKEKYIAKCIQTNQASLYLATELVSFFSRLQKEDTAGRILFKLHTSLISFRWTHEYVK